MMPNQTISYRAEHDLGTRAVAVDWNRDIAAANPLTKTHPHGRTPPHTHTCLAANLSPVASSAACTRFNLMRMKELEQVRGPVGLAVLHLDAVSADYSIR